MSTIEQPRTGGGPPGADWEEVQRSAEFVELRRRLRTFVFPMTVAFLAWYLLYVLMATYARGFMSQKVVGNINIGLIFGLLQFLSTFLITWAYVRYANNKLDPLAAQLRARIEDGDAEPLRPRVDDRDEPLRPRMDDRDDEPLRPRMDDRDDEPLRPRVDDRDDEPLRPRMDDRDDEPRRPRMGERDGEPRGPRMDDRDAEPRQARFEDGDAR